MISFNSSLDFGNRTDLVLKIKDILTSYSDILTSAILFGSTARGTFNDESDIDLFITCDFMTTAQVINSKRYGDLELELYSLTDSLRIDYDLLVFGRNKLNKVKESMLYKHIQEDGVILYDARTDTM